MSSFFTLPASQRKRKRDEGKGPARAPAPKPRTKPARQGRDDSISGSDLEGSDDGGHVSSHTLSDESSSDEDEGVAARRTKLAARYLENTRREILAEGFDAKDIDNELLAQRMGERLKEDTAESKGRVYRFIADDYDVGACATSRFSNGSGALTGVTACHPFIYTVSKDARLSKWEVPGPDGDGGKPRLVASAKGDRSRRKDPSYDRHTNEIYCVAASMDGRFVATGGKDRKLVVWDAATLKPLRAFAHHRDAVMSLAFRRGTNQLFTASRDRTIKIWSLDELAYIETLYGHQDEIVDVASLTQEHCVTVGARDRTARFWKVVEENQLIFNGGGARNSLRKRGRPEPGEVPPPPTKSFHEGSIDRVAMLDEDNFVTGSDNGGLSLWNVHKKKPIFTWPLAHGVEDPKSLDDTSAELFPDPKSIPEPQPRCITALVSVPFANMFFSGSWDGHVRAWKLSDDRRSVESLGSLGQQSKLTNGLANGLTNGHADSEHEEVTAPLAGIVNDLAVYESEAKGKGELGIVAATGKSHRTGRWDQPLGRNATTIFHIPRKQTVVDSEA